MGQKEVQLKAANQRMRKQMIHKWSQKKKNGFFFHRNGPTQVINTLGWRRVNSGSHLSLSDRSGFVRYAGVCESVELTADRQVRSYSPLTPEASCVFSLEGWITHVKLNTAVYELISSITEVTNRWAQSSAVQVRTDVVSYWPPQWKPEGVPLF